MLKEREHLLSITRKLSESGLNRGTSGNVSVRVADGLLVTPSGMEVEAMTPHDMVWMDGKGKFHGERQPSSGRGRSTVNAGPEGFLRGTGGC